MYRFIQIFLLLIIIIGLFYLLWKEKKKNKKIILLNQKVQEQNTQIQYENKYLINEKNNIQKDIEQKQVILNNIQQSIMNLKNTSQQAFENYIDILDKEYKIKEQEYEKSVNLLNESYNNIQNKVNAKIDQIYIDLDNITSLRAAAIEAQRKEKLIKENKKDFSLNIDDMSKNDILLLERIKKDFSNPRIISMLIWQTYYRDIMSELCDYLLGTKAVCGIYKITNQLTDECYIGQSVDVAKRWKDHVKCGLDIDRPSRK